MLHRDKLLDRIPVFKKIALVKLGRVNKDEYLETCMVIVIQNLDVNYSCPSCNL